MDDFRNNVKDNEQFWIQMGGIFMVQIVLVNEEDKIVGSCEKLYTHEKGYLHRAFSVFVFNSKGEMLIQQRAEEKYHSGGLWSNSCCSHQIAGEELIQDIHNRLKFELGIEVKDLKEHFVYSYRAELNDHLIENEVDHIYTAICDTDIKFNPSEVMAIKWVKVQDVIDDIKLNPSQYSYWFTGTIEQVKECL